MQKNKPIIWALNDDRPGNNNQALGIAENLSLKLGTDFITKKLQYNNFIKLDTRLKFKSLLGLNFESKQQITAPWPDLVFSVGRRMEGVALYIKKQNPATKIIHILKPSINPANFDMVVAPWHDYYKLPQDQVPKNVVLTNGAPNRINLKVLENAKTEFAEAFLTYKAPRIGVLVGGSTKRAEFTMQHAEELMSLLGQLKTLHGASLCITTSRRTPDQVIQYLEDNIGQGDYFYNAKKPGKNPYFGLLTYSDIIVVTGDSVSMCSESCSTGKLVYIYMTKSLTAPKFSYFQEKLITDNYAFKLDAETIAANAKIENILQQKFPILNEAASVVEVICAKLIN